MDLGGGSEFFPDKVYSTLVQLDFQLVTVVFRINPPGIHEVSFEKLEIITAGDFSKLYMLVTCHTVLTKNPTEIVDYIYIYIYIYIFLNWQ